jgi:putative oxidoreductase
MPIFLCWIGAAAMFFGGFCLIASFLTPLASIGILVSMAFALVLHIMGNKPFIAPDPYLNSPDDYQGPKGQGEAPSMEKAFVYILIMLVIIVFGPGAYSLDAVLFPNLVL